MRWGRTFRRAEARRAVADALRAAGPAGEARARLAALPRREQIRVLRQVAPGLGPDGRQRVRELAEELGLADHGRRLVASPFWWRRRLGARILTFAAGPDDLLPLLEDSDPEVRRQVVEWARIAPSNLAVTTLVRLLGDPDEPTRFAAQDALVRIGEPAVEPLAATLLQTTDPRAARAGLLAVRGLRDGRLADPVVRLADHPSPEVRAAAFRAMARLDRPRAPTGTGGD